MALTKDFKSEIDSLNKKLADKDAEIKELKDALSNKDKAHEVALSSVSAELTKVKAEYKKQVDINTIL